MHHFSLRAPTKSRRPRPRLHLRELEDRTVPATPTITWDGGGNSFDWNTAANWSDAVTHLDRLPGLEDNVEIGAAFSGITITSAVDFSIQSLTSYANLEISGGECLLAADSHLFGKLDVAGTFGGSGNVTVDGLFTWHGSLVGVGGHGSLTADGGTLVPANLNAWLDNFHYVNPSGRLFTWNGANIFVNGGSEFENAGRVELWTDAGMQSSDAASKFCNSGTLAKLGGSTAPELFYGSVFEVGHTVNTGTIQVEVGTLALSSTPASPVENRGSISARAELGQPKTTVWLLNGVDSTGSIDADRVRFHTADPVVFSIAGSFAADRTQLYNGNSTVRMTGTVAKLGELDVGGHLDLSDATFTPAGRTLASLNLAADLTTDEDLIVDGLFTWHGSLVGVGGHGSLRALGTTTVTGGAVSDLQVINAGTLNWTAGNVSFYGPTSSFTNAAGATFDDQVDGIFGSYDANMQVFNNEGLFIKSGGDGTTFLRMQLVNSGFIDVRRGTLDISNYIPNGGGGSGDIHGGVDNGGEGRSDPGPNPQPTYTSFRQRASGSLTVTIRGLAAGTQYGQISVNGSVELDGTLKVIVNPLQGYTPAVGQTFAIINKQSSGLIVGTFATPAPGTMLWDTTHRFGFDVSYTTAYGSDGIANDVVLTLVVANSAPTANAGGPYSIAEGASLSLNASGSSDPDGDPLTYSWDVNGDGTFGDATGVSPTLTWSQLQALGIDDGPHPFNVRVRVDDGNIHVVDSAAAPLVLANTAPTATLSNGGSVTYGQSIGAGFGSPFDPSAADTSAGFHYAFSIDDGGSGLAAATYASTTGDSAHSYSGLGAGTHTIYARIIDKDDGYTQYSTSVTIDPATPDFSVTSIPPQTVGTASVTLSGTLRAGSLVPTGSVTVALAGAGTQQVMIGPDGTFSATFLTGGLQVGAHAVTFDYGGDANFDPVTASATLDDTYGVSAVVNVNVKKKATSLSVHVELQDANCQNISVADKVIKAWGIQETNSSESGKVGTADASQLGSRTLTEQFDFHRGAKPGYDCTLTNVTGLVPSHTYRLYFEVAGDPLLHWVAFTV